MDTNEKGKIIELEVLTTITKLGHSVSIPFGDKNKYDQIWDIKGKLLKIQIKTCRWKDEEHTGIIFNCYSVFNGIKHFYTKDDIDYFVTYWEGKCYMIPVEECKQEKTLWFVPKQLNSCKYAKDYEVENIINDIIN